MIEPSKAYSRRQLISVAEVASTLAASRNIAGLEAVQQLAEAVRVGMLCPDLYPPHQQWQHGGDAKRIGKPSGNSSGVWHSLAAASAKRHMSDKDDFNYPPAASTWHVLADDVMKYAGHHSIPSRVCAALQELAARYKPELTAEPPLKAEDNRFLAGESDDAPAKHRVAPERTGTLEPFDNDGWRTMAQERACEIIANDRVRDLYPSQENIADQIAKEFRASGVRGSEGKPLSGATIKRHALRGISSAEVRRLSTRNTQGK